MSSAKFSLDSSLFTQDLYVSILRLWLPNYPNPSSQFAQANVLRWFAPSATTDGQVHTLAAKTISSIGPEHLTLPPFTSIEDDRELYDEIAAPFIPHLRRSSGGTAATVEDVSADAHAALALSILLDQFPRNLFRGATQAVVYTHYDRLARALAANIFSRGLDRAECFANAPVWRYWFYMPLEHSESVRDQEQFQATLEVMRERARETGDEMGVGFVERAMEHARRHLRSLQEFGRFPWRDQWLERGYRGGEKVVEGGS
ncbi:MAG: hypothetical protein Q9165_000828 [Trypethelium subeluteriae]